MFARRAHQLCGRASPLVSRVDSGITQARVAAFAASANSTRQAASDGPSSSDSPWAWATATLTLLGAGAYFSAEQARLEAAPAPKGAQAIKSGMLPVYTRAEVEKHRTRETRVWVTYKDGVYDITDFIPNHPGGSDKIMLAAGKSIDAFWQLYQQHYRSSVAQETLERSRVGTLDPKDVAEASKVDAKDPFANDPPAHPALLLHARKPCTAEVPRSLLLHNWVTPSDLWYIRSHHPVPKVDAASQKLQIRGPGLKPLELSVDDLKKRFPKRTVTTTLQCGGNRRAHMDALKKTSGIAWGPGAISNGTWAGASLRDVLRAAGLDVDAPENQGVFHIVFKGSDDMQASIPVEKATSSRGDVLIAYELNGEPIPPHHGYPLRAVVPGVVGVRSVKWLSAVEASAEEATGPWQRGMAYKGFSPSLSSLDGVDVERIPSVQEQPVTSVIAEPAEGSVVDPDWQVATVRGYAYSGGGKGIVRVDVSADGGKTWMTATLKEGSEQPLSRAWAWTFWEADVPLPPGAEEAGGVEVVCKATDAAYNVQPERIDGIWNLRGLNTNAWHRVKLAVKRAEE